MARRFREHRRREVTDLSGVWDFEYLGDVELAGVEPAAIRFSDRMWAPIRLLGVNRHELAFDLVARVFAADSALRG